MKIYKKKVFWFITGSQHLYGHNVLEKVSSNSKKIAESLNMVTPANIIFKGLATTSDEVLSLIKRASFDDECIGIITWMHTFSPAKMWINGLKIISKPILHLNTQFNRSIPVNDIDMDFMNLNQSAHGDRKFGFICTRMHLPRKVIAGYWQDEDVHSEISKWMRSAIGISEGKTLRVARFGDNMREVAVTEGDKLEAQIRLGWSVNTYALEDLTGRLVKVPEKEIDYLLEELKKKYTIKTPSIPSVEYQLRIELALKDFFKEHDINAFTTTFENLGSLKQLPGLACQRLMEAGYGFGAEGDWKTAALLRVIKTMQKGLEGGTSFIEDYTFHLPKGNELVLGACPKMQIN